MRRATLSPRPPSPRCYSPMFIPASDMPYSGNYLSRTPLLPLPPYLTPPHPSLPHPPLPASRSLPSTCSAASSSILIFPGSPPFRPPRLYHRPRPPPLLRMTMACSPCTSRNQFAQMNRGESIQSRETGTRRQETETVGKEIMEAETVAAAATRKQKAIRLSTVTN